MAELSPVRKAAIKASELYLEREEKRTLKQCIAIAANQHEVEWLAVANYLTGMGARAAIAMRNIEEIYNAARVVQENHWSVQNAHDSFSGDVTYYGVDYGHMVSLCTVLRDYTQAYELEPLKRRE